MRSALVGLVRLSVGNYVAILLSLLMSVVLARALGAREFGHLALILLASQVLQFLVTHWSVTTIVHFGAREFARSGSARVTLWTRLGLLVPPLVVVVLLISIFSPQVAGYLAIPEMVVWLILANALSTGGLVTCGALLQASGRMGTYGAILVIDRLVPLVIFLTAAPWMVPRAIDVMAVLTATVLAATIAGMILVGIRSLWPVAPSLRAYQEMWSFSIPLIASTWLGFFGSQWLDYAVIRLYLPLDHLGVYALAYALAGGLQQITIVIATYVLPRYSILAATGRTPDLRRVLESLLPYWFILFSIGLVVVIGVAEALIPLIFGNEYVRAVGPFRLLAVSTIFLAIFNSFNPVLIAFARNWMVSLAVLLSVLTNVVLDLFLVPIFGISGAAAATSGAYAVSAAVTAWAMRTVIGFPGHRYFLFAVPVFVAYIVMERMTGGIAILLLALVGGVATVGLSRLFDLRWDRFVRMLSSDRVASA